MSKKIPASLISLYTILLILEQSNFYNSYAAILPASKKISFDTPSYEKLDQGSGPQTNDNVSIDHNLPLNSTNNSDDLKPITNNISPAEEQPNPNTIPTTTAINGNALNELKPLKLIDSINEKNLSKESEPENGLLKSTVCATGFVPKDPLATANVTEIPTSIFGHKKKPNQTILEQAKQVSAMPLPLLESAEETDKKIDTIIDSEREELSQLWESTLTRSPDVQFVIQKLMPSNNKSGHATTILMRMLSTAMFGAMGAVTMMSPSIGTYAASSMGGSMVMNLLQLQEGKNAKKAKLSQTEAIMLYNMIRANADRLVDCFRNYKKNLICLDRANIDLTDLQAMVSDSRSNQDSSKQVDMEYTLRKARRDVDALAEEVRRYRQSLVDLAGTDAVCKLDKQINDEQVALKDPNAPNTVKTAQTASAL